MGLVHHIWIMHFRTLRYIIYLESYIDINKNQYQHDDTLTNIWVEYKTHSRNILQHNTLHYAQFKQKKYNTIKTANKEPILLHFNTKKHTQNKIKTTPRRKMSVSLKFFF